MIDQQLTNSDQKTDQQSTMIDQHRVVCSIDNDHDIVDVVGGVVKLRIGLSYA